METETKPEIVPDLASSSSEQLVELEEKKYLESAGMSPEHSSLAIEAEPTATDEEQLLEMIPTENENKPSSQSDGNQNATSDASQEDNLLEFESGLHHLLTENPTPKENTQEQISEDENSLDFVPSASADVHTQEDEQGKNLANLKNKKALDTLLALARTYIGMEDIESALHSLNEVMEHGSKSQQEDAQRLIDEIKGKS